MHLQSCRAQELGYKPFNHFFFQLLVVFCNVLNEHTYVAVFVDRPECWLPQEWAEKRFLPEQIRSQSLAWKRAFLTRHEIYFSTYSWKQKPGRNLSQHLMRLWILPTRDILTGWTVKRCGEKPYLEKILLQGKFSEWQFILSQEKIDLIDFID